MCSEFSSVLTNARNENASLLSIEKEREREKGRERKEERKKEGEREREEEEGGERGEELQMLAPLL